MSVKPHVVAYDPALYESREDLKVLNEDGIKWYDTEPEDETYHMNVGIDNWNAVNRIQIIVNEFKVGI